MQNDTAEVSNATDCSPQTRLVFRGFRGWKIENGEFVQHITAVCESCNVMRLCRVVARADPDAIVSVSAGYPMFEVCITIDDRRDISDIMAMR